METVIAGVTVYYQGDKIEECECSTQGRDEKHRSYIILFGETVVKRPLGGHRHRWEYNIHMDLGKQCDCVDWIYLFQNKDKWRAVVTAVTNCRVL